MIGSKIIKESQQSALYPALQYAYQNDKLQRKPLNKNCKLSSSSCHYFPEENLVKISPSLYYDCFQKFPQAYLEITFGHLICTESLELDLINFQVFYVLLANYNQLNKEINIIPTIIDEIPTSLVFPILGISVISQPNEKGISYHTSHYILATIL